MAQATALYRPNKDEWDSAVSPEMVEATYTNALEIFLAHMAGDLAKPEDSLTKGQIPSDSPEHAYAQAVFEVVRAWCEQTGNSDHQDDEKASALGPDLPLFWARLLSQIEKKQVPSVMCEKEWREITLLSSELSTQFHEPQPKQLRDAAKLAHLTWIVAIWMTAYVLSPAEDKKDAPRIGQVIDSKGKIFQVPPEPVARARHYPTACLYRLGYACPVVPLSPLVGEGLTPLDTGRKLLAERWTCWIEVPSASLETDAVKTVLTLSQQGFRDLCDALHSILYSFIEITHCVEGPLNTQHWHTRYNDESDDEE